ncbi:DUF294 nucleotidyltransferase-like domain-containing protein [Bacillus xiapuensis]|uniref:DUF294 nucleotidyltransferase-like domain-containing protein n=1 Tax=Bacillus xiapuensis TaxID=2014075 RepID=A0ABU6N961_9BACI|nr:DUF294 nucleotidyltransferase-like domain-containing protein [Bacillus xiapuensis]
MEYPAFSEIKKLRDKQIKETVHDHFKLNRLHDEIIKQVVSSAINHLTKQIGPPPSPFSFFAMGSAGRLEQSIWSDQDHGIIYQNQRDETKIYFLTLGKVISHYLHEAGYEYCDGGVMASSPLWCKSFPEWQEQLINWITESSWESIRHLLIFIDGRTIFGEHTYIHQLKSMIYDMVKKENLLPRILNNTLHVKKGIGILGQFLIETHGSYSGSINLKEIAFFPYVNSVRLLAIKEQLQETSTLSRLTQLQFQDKERYKEQFLKLLKYRLTFGNHTDYESGHFLPIAALSKQQKNELKDIIKNGITLLQMSKKLAGKED